MARFGIVTMMKDEGPRILEWLAYHRLIGAEDIWIYSNDCRDGSDLLLDHLAKMGLCHHIRNVVPPGKKPQPHALNRAGADPAVHAPEWLIVMDADEFLHIKTGDGTLAALLAACPAKVDGIAMNWRMMGSNEQIAWSDASLMTQFTRGADDDFRRGWGVKTLFRPFAGMKLGIHRPSMQGAKHDHDKACRLLDQIWVNGSAVRMPPSFMRDGWRGSAATTGYALAEIAHFAVQSREAYLLRGDRGNVNLKPQKYDATYFAMFDRNEKPHLGLLRWSGWVEALVTDWLQDHDLKRLLQSCRAWHHARLCALRDAPGFAVAMESLARAAAVPVHALDKLLFIQPLSPEGKRRVAALRAQGVADAQIAEIVTQSVAQLEAARDAREAAELRALGLNPRGLG
ncbi:glycosyltransferase family 2 protein [Roseicyclus sp.]|uniref:glycosyltransferase family 2 protein n=1 Tax=Roseicyclus sp. TaxID=1914329 RepID=UPI003F6D408D